MYLDTLQQTVKVTCLGNTQNAPSPGEFTPHSVTHSTRTIMKPYKPATIQRFTGDCDN